MREDITLPELKKDHERLVRRYNAMLDAVAALEATIQGKQEQIDFYVAQLANCERNLGIQKGIVIQNLTERNDEQQTFAKELALLQTEIKELKANGAVS